MKKTIVLTLLLLLLVVASLTAAQGNSFSIPWWTVDGGGGMSSSGRYTLHAAIGQPDAGTMSGSHFTLLTGYWDGLDRYAVSLPLVLRP